MWTLLDEAASLQHQQELFEMHVSQYLPLTRCQVLLHTMLLAHTACRHQQGETFFRTHSVGLMIVEI